MIKEHRIKIEKKYYDRIWTGQKTFDVRLNDRDYQVGDRLMYDLVEKGRNVPCETGETEKQKIVYIHDAIGMTDGYVVLGIKKWEE